MAGTFKKLILSGSMLAIGGGATATAFVSAKNAPSNFSDFHSWLQWCQTDPANFAVVAVCATVGALGGVSSLVQIFGPKPVTSAEFTNATATFATKTDIEELKRFMAALQAERATGAAPLDPTLLVQQADTAKRILTSTEPIDQPARVAAEQGNIEKTIKELLEAAAADRSRAAQRFFDAGVLLFDRNVAQAIDAFEQAVSLDATNPWAWIFLSRLYQIASRTDVARVAAENAIAAAKNERDRSCGLDELGDTHTLLGDLDAALKAYREGLDVARKLAAADPTNAQALRDVSVSLDRIGDVQARQGDLDAALKAYREGLDIRRKLAAADPTNAQAKMDVGISLAKLGQVAETQGRHADACQHFTEAHQLFAAVAAVAPSWKQAVACAQASAASAARNGAAAQNT